MTTRVQQFRRVAGLREAQERACEAMLAQANGRVVMIEARIAREKQERARLLVEGREALERGELEPWRLLEGTNALAAERIDALEQEREGALAVAMEARARHGAARVQSEQAGVLLEDAMQGQRREQEHRMQRESDDRFAARLPRKRSAS